MDEPHRITTGLFVIAESPMGIVESAGLRNCFGIQRSGRIDGGSGCRRSDVRHIRVAAESDEGNSLTVFHSPECEWERDADRDIDRLGSLCASVRASVSQAGCDGAVTVA
jgi:hypothetical protein